jgi:hypothetical protein
MFFLVKRVVASGNVSVTGTLRGEHLPGIVAINKHGLRVIALETHEFFAEYALDEVGKLNY